MAAGLTDKKKRLLIPLGTPREPSPFYRALIFILRPILLPIPFVLGKAWKLCFGWLDNRLAKKDDEEFAQDIRTNLYLLFSERNARILSNEGKKIRRVFDDAYVAIAVDTLRFKFCRCRGEFHVQVASELDPERFEHLELVLETILGPAELKQALSNCQYLRTLSQVLYPQFDNLKAALSPDHLSRTLTEAVNLHNERVDRHVASLRQQGINPKIL